MIDKGIRKNRIKMDGEINRSWFSYKYLLFIGATFFSTVILALIFSYLVLVKFNAINMFLTISEIQNVRGMNFLIFGIDETQNTHRSDAIIVVHLDQTDNRVGLISIPRDTRVKIEGHGRTRINHAFSYGGAPLLQSTVSEFLDIPIDHYIQINLKGVEKFIDALGGVEIDVKKELVYVDYAGDLYINIKKGKQKMTGKKAIEYLRFRQDEEGDIGRIRRQQYFLNALVSEVSSFDNVFKFPKLIHALNDLIKTDISLKELTSFAFYFKNAISENAISKSTVPGRVSLIGGAYYWKANSEKLDVVIDEVLYGNKVPNYEIANAKELKTLQTNTLKSESLDYISESNSTELKTVSLDSFANSNVNETPTLVQSESVNPEVVISSLDKDENAEIKSPAVKSNITNETLEFDTEIISLDTNYELDKAVDQNVVYVQSVQEESRLDSSNSTKIKSKTDTSNILDETSKIEESTSKELSAKQEDDRRFLSVKEVQRFANVNGEYLISDFEGLKCEILNGVGVNGIAKGAAKILKSVGISVPRFANAGHFDYEETMIVDWHGSVNKSLELAMLLQIDPNNIIVYDNKSKPLNFTLVIGKDWFEKKELLEKLHDI